MFSTEVKTGRIGRFDRLNRKPACYPVRIVTGLATNQSKNCRIGQKLEKSIVYRFLPVQLNFFLKKKPKMPMFLHVAASIEHFGRSRVDRCKTKK